MSAYAFGFWLSIPLRSLLAPLGQPAAPVRLRLRSDDGAQALSTGLMSGRGQRAFHPLLAQPQQVAAGGLADIVFGERVGVAGSIQFPAPRAVEFGFSGQAAQTGQLAQRSGQFGMAAAQDLA